MIVASACSRARPVEVDDLLAALDFGHPQIAAVGVLPPGERLGEGPVEGWVCLAAAVSLGAPAPGRGLARAAPDLTRGAVDVISHAAVPPPLPERVGEFDWSRVLEILLDPIAGRA